MAELLLELLSEEIPARMQSDALFQLRMRLGGLIQDSGFQGAECKVRTFATPRRLAAHLSDLRLLQAQRNVERRGPKIDARHEAVTGFYRSLQGRNYETFQKDGFHYVLIREGERPALEWLAAEIPRLLSEFSWPKSMRWGSGEVRWIRPLQSIVCLLDGKVVPFEFGGLRAGNMTWGHRFAAPESFQVSDFADYVHKLREHRVLLDAGERRTMILNRAKDLAAEQRLSLRSDPALLDELAGLVEWPVPLLGRIDPAFMDIPTEVLVLTMRQNQRYLALETPDGRLADRFVLVANIEAPDGGAAIVAGNERVLRARLWDARFFWEQDRKRPLESGLPKLERMVFHAELGSLGEKVQRLVALTGALVPYVPGADRTLAERAALLAKADLVTGMVGEFPELQGIMGGHYARAQGEPEAVASAIAEHYAPRGPDDRCPAAPASVLVALADRLDTLAGFFARDIRPTGSKDPFALRRAALGSIRLILENGLRLPLRRVFEAALAGYGQRLEGVDAAATGSELLRFFADRLKVHLRERGVRHDLVSAVFAVGEDDDLVRLLARVQALRRFLESEDGRNLLVAFRRASNIVAIEEKRDGRSYAGEPRPELLRDPVEAELHRALAAARGKIEAALAAENFEGAMAALAALRRPVDRFFDKVMVNVEQPELRANRLLLLSRIRSALGTVADFNLIEDAGAAAA